MTAIPRAKRNIDFVRGVVPEAIGPGTYNPNDKWSLKHSQAPFGSTSSREVTEIRNPGAPGPGQYTGDIVKGNAVVAATPSKDAKQSCMFASRSSRMAYEQTLLRQTSGLGPGSYQLPELPWVKPNHTKQRTCSPSSHIPTSSAVSLAAAISGMAAGTGPGGAKALNWSKVSTAPSIPAPNQSYGYEEGPAGELVQQRPTVDKTSMPSGGPAHYDPEFKLVKLKAPSVPSFSASKVPRLTSTSKFGGDCPGPGAYEVAPATWTAEQDLRPSHIFLSTTNRGVTIQEKKLVPGPGSYDVKSQFPPAKPKALTDAEVSATGTIVCPPSRDDVFQAFGRTYHPPEDSSATGPSQTQSSSGLPTAVLPGPGAYNPTVSAFQSIVKKKNRRTRTGEIIRNGFGSSERFPEATHVTSAFTPGPGYYGGEKDTLTQKLSHKLVGRYGVFGTTSQRFPSSRTGALDASVGPGTYASPPPRSPSELRRKDLRSSVFMSKTARHMPGTSGGGGGAEGGTKKADEGPCVGWYNPPASPWIKKQSQVATNFLAQAPRFKDAKGTVTPGPGYYDSSTHTLEAAALGSNIAVVKGEVRRTNHKGINRSGLKIHLTSAAPRFKQTKEKDKVPGPGAYDVSENFALIKKTYNITVGDSW